MPDRNTLVEERIIFASHFQMAEAIVASSVVSGPSGKQTVMAAHLTAGRKQRRGDVGRDQGTYNSQRYSH